MVAKDRINMHPDTDNHKTRLKTVRYINKNESVLCVCHVDDEERNQQSAASSTDTDSDPGTINCSKADSTSPSKENKRPKRKSVTFRFNVERDNSFTDSIVSEPPPTLNPKHDMNSSVHNDDFALPPLKPIGLPVGSGKALTPSTKVNQWVSNKRTKPAAVPERMFQTLHTLGLSPRVTRKMSGETLSDIRNAVGLNQTETEQLTNKKRSSIYDSNPAAISVHHSPNLSRKLLKPPLDPISEKTSPRISHQRQIDPIHPYPKLPTLISSFVASDSEMERLNFIKRALSPAVAMPPPVIPPPHEEMIRDRAATISGGEKRSWVIHRRNSREHIGTAWMDAVPKEIIDRANKVVDGQESVFSETK